MRSIILVISTMLNLVLISIQCSAKETLIPTNDGFCLVSKERILVETPTGAKVFPCGYEFDNGFAIPDTNLLLLVRFDENWFLDLNTGKLNKCSWMPYGKVGVVASSTKDKIVFGLWFQIPVVKRIVDVWEEINYDIECIIIEKNNAMEILALPDPPKITVRLGAEEYIAPIAVSLVGEKLKLVMRCRGPGKIEYKKLTILQDGVVESEEDLDLSGPYR